MCSFSLNNFEIVSVIEWDWDRGEVEHIQLPGGKLKALDFGKHILDTSEEIFRWCCV